MVEKLVALNGYEQRLKNFYDDIPLNIALPYLANPDEASALKAKYARPGEMKKIYYEVYSKYMTGDDILNLIAFAKSPTGRKFVEFDEHIRIELQKRITELATIIAIDMVKDNIKKRKGEQPGQDDLILPEL